MLKVIMGNKGAGKTKNIIELVTKAVEEDSGAVVCIEKGNALTFDIPHSVRLVEAPADCTGNLDFLKGMLCGMHASNYDISYIFVDGLFRIVGPCTDRQLEQFLDWCDAFSEDNGIKLTVTASSDASVATEGIKKYF